MRKQISAKSVGCLQCSTLFNIVLARRLMSASTHSGSLKNDSSTSLLVVLGDHDHLSSHSCIHYSSFTFSYRVVHTSEPVGEVLILS